ncbi:MAG TPA: cytochrome d ubiquinol oxidase subunit II [Desulfobacter postgatei]|jgi:cytochrome d ubiquinol oxidase subunit II|uniref:cytochrome d ubiquinol oxidase subunit II n=1 Tax=Desulfobacter sp. TaxID=2294 RepID=UPI001B4CB0E0|nr:cytochrome d ubiquinol oxidase subunit II [Desulfobacter sp.]MBP8829754.1 cytochrome d ubiquinol oxidase subunit II [Desulfobacter sp.]HRF89406.1 cytochrome d ubiquinol oxidase subunit II [Desulfobacter postgatei]
MFSFEGFIDLPLIWYALIGTAIFLYVLLDGFDLGIGILFPFAPSEKCQDRMMQSIAPFWDGNETWLVMGGGGLFAAFPLAYAILMPAFYIPVILMLLGLILRGVSFEFRFKAHDRSKKRWGYVFHLGSLVATLTQGMILGAFVQGVSVTGRTFSGGAFDWLNAFSVMTGVALVAGYALLGAAWLIMKTEDVTQEWARKCTGYLFWHVALFMGLVSLCMPIMDTRIRELWFDPVNFTFLSVMPVSCMVLFWMVWQDLRNKNEYRPFFLIQGIFLMNYIGIGVSTWPWLVPYRVTFRDAAAAAESQSLLLIGAVIMLPVVLAYTGYCYWIFRGKSSHETSY